MEQVHQKFINLLEESTKNCNSTNIALSGGLDSSVLAYCLRDRKLNGYVIIADEFVANDLTYSQMIASNLNISLKINMTSTEEITTAIDGTIKILKNFNDIEIRNSLVPYLTLELLRKKGEKSIITGDGADELFAGYNFLLKKSNEDLQIDLNRFLKIMHFPSKKIGDALGVIVETPFLSSKMIEFAKNLPINHKIDTHGDKKIGKMIVREAFDKKIPKQIVWREKSPMQDGSGTAGLTNLFETLIPNHTFEEKKQKILKEDGVNIRTKESLHYYQTFRKFFDLDNKDGDKTCPDCKHRIEENSRFCRMCGRFPI